MESLAKGRWVAAFMVIALILCVIPAAPSHAGPRIKVSAMQTAADEFYGPNDGPAFMMISVQPEFDVPFIGVPNGSLKNSASDLGSQVVLVNVGKFIAGDDVSTTRFEAPTAPVNVVLPTDDFGNPLPIVGNRATIVGGFQTLELEPVAHLMTPIPQPFDEFDERFIPVAVQTAYFNASRLFTEAQYPPPGTEPRLSQFPTTVELAYFIYENQGGAGAEFQDILNHVFQSNMMIPHHDDDPPEMRMVEKPYEDPDTGEMYSVLEAEGDLFPHQPADGLFRYRFQLGKKGGQLKFDMVLPVDVDIKPGSSQNSVNLGSEGVLPVAILTRTRVEGTTKVATFNAATEVDPDTIRAVVFDYTGFEVLLDAIYIEKYTITDLNDDGFDDVLVHFRTQDLVGVVLTEQDIWLDVRANTKNNSMLLQGSDYIRVVPPK